MRTVVAIPPMPRMTGGIAVLYQIADRLRELGLDVALTGQPGAPGLADCERRGHAVLPWDAVAPRTGAASVLRKTDCFVIAEGWPNMAAPAFAAKARVLVYAQNWAYVFSGLPEGVSWRNLPVTFLAVSQPVAHFVEDMAGLPLSGIVRPALDLSRFKPSVLPETANAVRVAWMPRKNKALAGQVMRIFDAVRSRNEREPRVEWVEIRNMTPDEVARTLASCHIFLATGFPEGCPLPPLEAMASGSLVVGFAGFGGWDYMRQAGTGRYGPRLEPRPVPWGGNGLFAADGDVMEAVWLLRQAVSMAHADAPDYRAVLAEGLKTAAAYSADAQREAVRGVWDGLENR